LKTDNNKRVSAQISIEKLISENTELSIRRLSTLAEISYTLIRKVLLVDFKLTAYKYQECQKLLEADYEKRVDFATWLLSLPPWVFEYIICTDEAYFYLVESINKQNNRMWLKERPLDWTERPLHDEKVLVWCGISANKIYGPYFFETTVNQHTYLEMLKTFFWQKHLDTADYKQTLLLPTRWSPCAYCRSGAKLVEVEIWRPFYRQESMAS
jgi:hypothetical protein